MGIATRIAVRLTPDPPAVRTLLVDFTSIDDAAATVSGDHRRRHRARRARDDGRRTSPARSRTSWAPAIPVDAAAVLLVEVDGLPAASTTQVERGARRSRRARRADRAGRGRRRRARAAVEGPQVGVRRDRPHRARLLPARRGRAPHPARRGAATRLRDRRRATARGDERVPRRRRQPAPADRRSTRASPACWSGCTPPATRSSPPASTPAVCSRASTASGSRSATSCRMFSPDDLDAQARLRDAFDPDGAANPGKVLPAGSRCGELQRVPEGRGSDHLAGDVDEFAEEVGGVDAGPSWLSAAARSWTSGVRCSTSARVRCGRRPASSSTSRPR